MKKNELKPSPFFESRLKSSDAEGGAAVVAAPGRAQYVGYRAKGSADIPRPQSHNLPSTLFAEISTRTA